ncbi:MAG: hypothetical protein E7006_01425 [Alphaproteobacteria bacterium]|nr:hypothetical protein [Alphaproteobacteria bacterium]
MNKITYFGDGQSMDFAFSFNFFQTSDIYVKINGTPQTSGYTLTCINSTTPADIPYVGGTISFNTPPKSTDIITIYRKIELTRVVDYQQTEKINPETLNQDFNYLMEVIKDCDCAINDFTEKYADLCKLPQVSQINEKLNKVQSSLDNCAQKTDINALQDATGFTNKGTTAIANMAMPSNQYTELTLGADGTTYTAPADGYFYIAKISTAAGQRIGLLEPSGGPGTMIYSTDTGQTLMVFLPARKNQTVQLRYTLGGTTNVFKFIYANGAK